MDIIRYILSSLVALLFLSGAIGFIISPNQIYPGYLYLACAIIMVIGVAFDILIFIYKNLKK